MNAYSKKTISVHQKLAPSNQPFSYGTIQILKTKKPIRNIELGFKPTESPHFDSVTLPVEEIPQHFELSKDGIEKIELTPDFKDSLRQARAIGLSQEHISEKELDYMENGGAIKSLQTHIEALLRDRLGPDIEFRYSTSIKIRSSDRPSGFGKIIPANTIFHVDYLTLDDAYERLFEYNNQLRLVRDGIMPLESAVLDAPPFEYLRDVINLWIPLQDSRIQNYNLGFLEGETNPELVPIELVVGVRAGAVFLGDHSREFKIICSSDLRWGQMLLFRSAGPQARIHGAVETLDRTFIRKSIEIRVGVFRPSRKHTMC